MKKTLRSKLIILIIPFLMGFTEDGCGDFLFIWFFLTYQPPVEVEDPEGAASPNGVGRSFDLKEISVYDDGLVSIGGFPSETDIATRKVNNSDLNDITYWAFYEIGNVIVGDSGTLVMLLPNFQIDFLSNPAGSYNLNAVSDPLALGIGSILYAVGDSGTVIKSSDKGLTWEWLIFPSRSNLRDVKVDFTGVVYVSGDNYTALKSLDSGKTWIPVVPGGGEKQIPAGDLSIDEKLNRKLSPEYNDSYNKIYFYDDSIGYIAGPHGFILKTINGGLDWTGKFAQGFEQVTDLFFISPDSGVAAGTNGIARFTTDGGDTWFEDTSVTNYLAGRTINRLIPFGDRYGIILGEGDLDIFIAPDSTYLDSLLVTSVEENSVDTELPNEFALYQNYPNPFNPNTVISYQLPVNSHVSLKVYDILGREVVTLVNETKKPGNYTVTFNASDPANRTRLASGIYFYQLTANGYKETKKLVFLK